MTVYVDPLFTWTEDSYRGKDAAQAKRVGGRNGHQWCHMFADEKDCVELHRIARTIGLRRQWFQGDHYDLTPSKRRYAVSLGVTEVSRQEAIKIWRKQREHAQVQTPRPR
jgi:hypothetical protein